jgi:hypothetical protein
MESVHPAIQTGAAMPIYTSTLPQLTCPGSCPGKPSTSTNNHGVRRFGEEAKFFGSAHGNAPGGKSRWSADQGSRTQAHQRTDMTGSRGECQATVTTTAHKLLPVTPDIMFPGVLALIRVTTCSRVLIRGLAKMIPLYFSRLPV